MLSVERLTKLRLFLSLSGINLSMVYSLKSLNRVYTNLDRFFFFSPLAGSIFIGISIYFKIYHSTDHIDFINMVLNLFSLIFFALCYSLLIISGFRKEPEQKKKLKITAYTVFSLTYYIYGIVGVLVTAYYNIMLILVLLISLLMFRLIPDRKSSLYIAPCIGIYCIIALGQEFEIIGLFPEQIENRNGGYLLMLVFSIKCVLLVLLNISKVINLKLLQIEREYCSGEKEEAAGADGADMEKCKPINTEVLSELCNILTDREYEVTHLLLRGLTYKEIANTLEISINTVQSHIKSIYGKYYVNSRTALFRLYKERILSAALLEKSRDTECPE